MTYTIFNCLLFTFSKKWNTGILICLVIEKLGQVAKLKRTWNLASVLQIVQKVTVNYSPCLYLSTGWVWWLHELWFKRYIQKCTLSHVLILVMTSKIVSHGIVKNTKTWISWEWDIIFYKIKKFFNLCFRWHLLRSYRFVAEVTFCHDFLVIWEKWLD